MPSDDTRIRSANTSEHSSKECRGAQVPIITQRLTARQSCRYSSFHQDRSLARCGTLTRTVRLPTGRYRRTWDRCPAPSDCWSVRSSYHISHRGLSAHPCTSQSRPFAATLPWMALYIPGLAKQGTLVAFEPCEDDKACRQRCGRCVHSSVHAHCHAHRAC